MRLTIFAILGSACLTGCLKIGNLDFGQTSLFRNRRVPEARDSVLPGALRILFNGQSGTSPVVFNLGGCSGPYEAQAIHSASDPAPTIVRRNTTVSLSINGSSPPQLYTENCSTQISSVEIGDGQTNSEDFWIRAGVPGSHGDRSVTASASLGAGSRNISVLRVAVAIGIGTNATSVVNDPTALSAGGGSCQTFFVNDIDAVGGVYQAGPLGGTVSRAANGRFHTDGSCGSTPTLTTTLDANRKFYYKNNDVGTNIDTITVIVDDGRTKSKAVSVDSIPRSLSFIPLPPTAGNPTTHYSGVCTPIQIWLRDSDGGDSPSSGTTTVNVVANVGTGPNFGSFYSASNCSSSTTVTSFSIANNSTSAIRYFKANQVPNHDETIDIELSHATLTVPSAWQLNFQVQLREVFLTDLSGSLEKDLNIGNGDYLLSGYDGRLNGTAKVPYTLGAGAQVTLTSSLANGSFHTDSEVAGGNESPFTFASGESQKTFYYRNDSTSGAAVTFTATGPTYVASGVPAGTHGLNAGTFSIPLRLDTSFDGDGKLVSGSSAINAMVEGNVGSDQRLVTAGTEWGPVNRAFITSYELDGDVDWTRSFDPDVPGTIPPEKYSTDARAMVKVGSDFVITGTAEHAGETKYFIARYEPDGDLAAQFIGEFVAGSFSMASAISWDGSRVIVAGHQRSYSGPYDPNFTVAAHNLAALTQIAATSFSMFGTTAEARGIAVQAAGSFTLAGILDPLSSNRVAAAAVTFDGANFTVACRGQSELGTARAAIRANDGATLVAGNKADGSALVARFNATCTGINLNSSVLISDTMTDGNNIRAIALYSASAGHPDSGKILLAGDYGFPNSFLLARYKPTGAPDTNDVTNARYRTVTAMGAPAAEQAYAVTLLSDGRIATAGSAGGSIGMTVHKR